MHQAWLLSPPPALLSSSFHLCLVRLINVYHNPSFSIKNKQTKQTIQYQHKPTTSNYFPFEYGTEALSGSDGVYKWPINLIYSIASAWESR